MKRDKWIWMPHAGHLIVGHDCRFHLSTYVGGYIVSTVGEYWPDSKSREIKAQIRGIAIEGKGNYWDADYMRKIGYEEIGCDRLYETMVFKAKRGPRKKDEDCCPWRQKDERDLDFRGYKTPGDALRGHMQLCEKWSRKGASASPR